MENWTEREIIVTMSAVAQSIIEDWKEALAAYDCGARESGDYLAGRLQSLQSAYEKLERMPGKYARSA